MSKDVFFCSFALLSSVQGTLLLSALGHNQTVYCKYGLDAHSGQGPKASELVCSPPKVNTKFSRINRYVN